MARRNAGAEFSLKYHLVWCPKYRRPVLVGPVAQRLRELLMTKAQEIGATVQALEVQPEHVHCFIESDPTRSPASLARELKGFTSHHLRREFRELHSRLPTLWSRSYYIGSIGHVSEATVRKYIEAQKGK